MARTQGTDAGAAGLSKSELAYGWIKERITRHEFSPGYRLVLGTIGTELGMSVVPVREAVRQLEAEGLVTFERNVGARVAMVDEAQYENTMQVLGVLEAAACALASRVITAESLERARAVNDAMERSLAHFDPRTFTTLNQDFHRLLYAPCPNPRLVEAVDAEWARLGGMRYSTFAFVPGRAPESVREHGRMLELIADGAPVDTIERAMREHRAATLAAFLEHEHKHAPAGLLG